VDDSVDLLSVKLGEALLGHVVDKEVVADLGVSVSALFVGLGYSLGEDTGILGVEEKVNPGELGVLIETVPVASVELTLSVVGVDEHGHPLTAAIFIFKEAFTRNGGKVAFSVVAEKNPLFRQTAIVLSIIEGLEGEPVRGVGGRVTVIDALN